MQATLVDCATSCFHSKNTAGCVAVGFQEKGYFLGEGAERQGNCDHYRVTPNSVSWDDGLSEKGWMGVGVDGGCKDLMNCCNIWVK
jgi:hypothetical protein